jgi:hypothetical protein
LKNVDQLLWIELLLYRQLPKGLWSASHSSFQDG